MKLYTLILFSSTLLIGARVNNVEDNKLGELSVQMAVLQSTWAVTGVAPQQSAEQQVARAM